jgi:hypothetical protein
VGAALGAPTRFALHADGIKAAMDKRQFGEAVTLASEGLQAWRGTGTAGLHCAARCAAILPCDERMPRCCVRQSRAHTGTRHTTSPCCNATAVGLCGLQRGVWDRYRRIQIDPDDGRLACEMYTARARAHQFLALSHKRGDRWRSDRSFTRFVPFLCARLPPHTHRSPPRSECPLSAS